MRELLRQCSDLSCPEHQHHRHHRLTGAPCQGAASAVSAEEPTYIPRPRTGKNCPFSGSGTLRGLSADSRRLPSLNQQNRSDLDPKAPSHGGSWAPPTGPSMKPFLLLLPREKRQVTLDIDERFISSIRLESLVGSGTEMIGLQ